MLNLDQITEQGVRLDLQGLVILKDRTTRTEKSTERTSHARNKKESEQTEDCFELIKYAH